MDSIALIIGGKPEKLDVITSGEEATQEKWESCKKQVDDIIASGKTAKCFLFRNNPIVGILYNLGDTHTLEINTNEIYPEG